MNYRQPFENDYGISQYFGEKTTDPTGHKGIDYLTPMRTPILASESGTVTAAGWDTTGYGYRVIIKHADGNSTLYAHLKMVCVVAGQKVQKGQVIGYSGTTGNSTGPHLHFEIRDASGKAFDPLTVLHSSIEPAKPAPVITPTKPILKGADALGEDVEVVAPLGAKGWNRNFTSYDVFPQGTKLTYTGKTQEHNGYTYCECYPTPRTYWVAVNDRTTQILDNQKQE